MVKYLEYELRNLVRHGALTHDGFSAELYHNGLPVAKVNYAGDGFFSFLSWLDKNEDTFTMESNLIAWHQKFGSWHWSFNYEDTDAAISLLLDILANNKLAEDNILFRPTSNPDDSPSSVAPEQLIVGQTLLNYPSLVDLLQRFPDAVIWDSEESNFVELEGYLTNLPLLAG